MTDYGIAILDALGNTIIDTTGTVKVCVPLANNVFSLENTSISIGTTWSTIPTTTTTFSVSRTTNVSAWFQASLTVPYVESTLSYQVKMDYSSALLTPFNTRVYQVDPQAAGSNNASRTPFGVSLFGIRHDSLPAGDYSISLYAQSTGGAQTEILLNGQIFVFGIGS